MDYKKRFETIARTFIKRKGIDELLAKLEKSDFYTAPASTRYHDSEEQGLVKHSLRVFSQLDSDVEGKGFNKESVAIVALFHDLCKLGYYKIEMRNAKDDRGQWIKVPYYTVDDKFPMGHGEKSIIMLLQYITLTTEEMMAIRWHMGGFEPKENYGTLSMAYTEFPLALYLHIADMKATYLK